MKRKTVSMLVVLLSISLLAGCGGKDSKKEKQNSKKEGITVEELVEKMSETEELKSCSLDFDVNVNIPIERESEKETIAVGAKGLLDYYKSEDTDELILYQDVDVDIDVPIMDIKESQNEKYYELVNKDGDVKWFMNTDNSDTWQEMDVSLNMDRVSEIPDIFIDVIEDSDDVNIADSTEKIGDEECYVLTVTTSPDKISSWLDFSEEMFEDVPFDVSEIYEYIPLKMTLYVSIDSGYCYKGELDLSDVDIEAILDVLGIDPEIIGIDSIDVDTILISYTMSNVNNVEVEIPEKVTANATTIGALGGAIYDDDYESDDDYGYYDAFINNDDGTFNLYYDENGSHYVVNGISDFELDSSLSDPAHLLFDESNNGDIDDKDVLIMAEQYPMFKIYLDGQPMDELGFESFECEQYDTEYTVEGLTVTVYITRYTFSDTDEIYEMYNIAFLDPDTEAYIGLQVNSIYYSEEELIELFKETFADYID